MTNYLPTAKSLSDSWLTIKLLAEAEPAFTEPAIRNHVFNADPRYTSKGTIPGNGLAPHIRRIGSKVLINHGGFLSWIDKDADGAGPRPGHSNQALNSPPGKYGNSPPLDHKGSEAELLSPALNAEPVVHEIQKIPATSYSKPGSRRRI